MHIREAYWIEQFVCCVNRYVPGRTTEESVFDDARHMHVREAYWIEQLVCCVNRYMPG